MFIITQLIHFTLFIMIKDIEKKCVCLFHLSLTQSPTVWLTEGAYGRGEAVVAVNVEMSLIVSDCVKLQISQNNGWLLWLIPVIIGEEREMPLISKWKKKKKKKKKNRMHLTNV